MAGDSPRTRASTSAQDHSTRIAHLEEQLRRAEELLQEQDAGRRERVSELRETELKMRQLAEHIQEVLWLHDIINDRNLYVSPAWEAVWQRPLSAVVDWSGTIHEDDRGRAIATTRSVTMNGNFDVTYRIRRPDGTIRWIRDRGFPVADEEGRMYRMAGIAEDITSRKREEEGVLRARDALEQRVQESTIDLVRVNEQLRQEIADRRAAKKKIRHLEVEMGHAARLSTVGEMTASIAHELNQPLAAIVQYGGACIEMMKAQGPGDERLHEFVSDMISQGLRAGEIIRRLRAFTQKRDPVRSPLSVQEALSEILPVLQVDARNREVAIELDLGRSVPPVIADRIQIQQVVANLVRNAIEALGETNPERPTIRVEAEQRCGSFVRISVADNGPGFSSAGLEKAFEPFYSTKERGMGLGLAIGKSIADAHDGRLVAANRPEGGALVWLELPIVRHGGADPDERSPVRPGTDGC